MHMVTSHEHVHDSMGLKIRYLFLHLLDAPPYFLPIKTLWPHSSSPLAGGNMVQFVTKRRETKSLRGGLCIDEDEARFYFLQLLSAVEYCHKHHVAHRWGGKA